MTVCHIGCRISITCIINFMHSSTKLFATTHNSLDNRMGHHVHYVFPSPASFSSSSSYHQKQQQSDLMPRSRSSVFFFSVMILVLGSSSMPPVNRNEEQNEESTVRIKQGRWNIFLLNNNPGTLRPFWLSTTTTSIIIIVNNRQRRERVL